MRWHVFDSLRASSYEGMRRRPRAPPQVAGLFRGGGLNGSWAGLGWVGATILPAVLKAYP